MSEEPDVEVEEEEECENCGGDGTVESPYCDCQFDERNPDCPHCDGAGTMRCSDCGGFGYYEKQQGRGR